MMSITHCCLAVTGASIILNTANPIILLSAAICSQLPDIDTSKSVPGRILFPISRLLEQRFPHRSITHSFIATFVVAAMTIPLLWFNLNIWLATILGYFFGWFGDVFTKTGVCAFYPSQVRAICPGNPRLRLSSNSPAEYAILAILVVAACISINAASSGGLVRGFSQTLGLPEGAIEIINQDISSYLMNAHVEGRNRISETSVNSNFEVVEALTQSDFLGKADGKMYRIGSSQACQIYATRVQIKRSHPIRVKLNQFQLEETSIDQIDLPKGDRSYISGSVVLESDDIVVPTFQDRFNTISLQYLKDRIQINANAASPAELERAMGDYDGTGSLIVRTIEVLQ